MIIKMKMLAAVGTIAAMASALAPMTASAATTVDWTFSGTNNGSGTITYDDISNIVTNLTGTYAGKQLSLITLFTDPNNPNAAIGYHADTGRSVYRGVPNTGGANYEYDNLFPQTPDTYGILTSTGTGADETVYLFGYDNQSALFFNIVTQPTYAYVTDRGDFTSSPAATGAVPEPATWAMMIVGMGAIGFSMRSAKRRSDRNFDAKIKRITGGALA